MRNVTIKYYKTGDMLMEDMANCVRCKVYTKCELHHVRTRARGGKKVVKLCRACHDWLGKNIAEARELGLYEGGYQFNKKKGE